jgi:hypothetical protein
MLGGIYAAKMVYAARGVPVAGRFELAPCSVVVFEYGMTVNGAVRAAADMLFYIL